MGRSSSIILALVVVATACTSGKATSPPESFEPPPKVRPPKTKKFDLSFKDAKGCLYRKRIDISSLAGRYFGPIDLTTDQVEISRNIDFTAPSDVDFVGPAEFRNVLKRIGKKQSPKEDRVDRWLEWSLGHRKVGSDGSSTPPGNPAELVAGLYIYEGKDVVVKQEGELDSEYLTLAHELAHAAADQLFGLPKKRPSPLIDDAALARNAVVEGDATLVEIRLHSRFANKKNVKKYVDGLFDNDKHFKQDRDAGVPYAILERFIFPYRWGFRFMCTLYKKEGWKALNRAFDHVPTTTADIMFPERYIKGQKPKEPPALGELPKPWKLFAKAGFGPFHLKVLFEAPLDYEPKALNNPMARAAAWNGGHYKLWGADILETDSVLGIAMVERPEHPGLLCSSMIRWYELTFPLGEQELIGDGTVAYSDSLRKSVISCPEGKVLVGIAPTQDLAAAAIALSD